MEDTGLIIFSNRNPNNKSKPSYQKILPKLSIKLITLSLAMLYKNLRFDPHPKIIKTDIQKIKITMCKQTCQKPLSNIFRKVKTKEQDLTLVK